MSLYSVMLSPFVVLHCIKNQEKIVEDADLARKRGEMVHTNAIMSENFVTGDFNLCCIKKNNNK